MINLFIKRMFAATVCQTLLLCATPIAQAADKPMEITVSTPGPRNLTYLPVDLISKIGADRAEGAVVTVRHFGGGGVALQDLMSRNADFAVAGLPAAMSLRAHDSKVVVLAPVSGAPLFVLMVRSGLRRQVRTVADLKGKVIGVNTSSLSSMTTSQQLAELVLKKHGISPGMVRMVPAGQSWDSQSSVLASGVADAVMGDEPFVSRLKAGNKVFSLVNLADRNDARSIPGGGFLHAALETREGLLKQDPIKAEIMVKILKRTLAWMAKATPEEIADKLEMTDPVEKYWIIHTLKQYPNIYSTDGRFSRSQLAETERFFRETSIETVPSAFLETMIRDQWSGRKD
jgi:NitT/TauT family transport system substrate-binding protein